MVGRSSAAHFIAVFVPRILSAYITKEGEREYNSSAVCPGDLATARFYPYIPLPSFVATCSAAPNTTKSSLASTENIM